MVTRRAPCACGRGKITQTEYGDDWNRYEYGPVKIECEECQKKYKIETVSHAGLLKSDGIWSNYYLVPIDYPDYDGITLEKVYPSDVSLYTIPFDEYLIKSYSYIHLQSSLEDMIENKALSRIKGDAIRICREHQKIFKTARVSIVLPKVEIALAHYNKYKDNYDNRAIIAAEEKKERKAYFEEKMRHAIRIKFL